MSKSVKVIIAIIVVVIVLYGGYRLYHHYSYQQPTSPVVATPTKSPVASPTAALTISPTAGLKVSPTVSPAATNGVYKMMTDPKGVSYLTDAKGMALYTSAKDTVGVSNCTGTCIINWPAYGPKTKPTTFPANITVITRTDKSLQYAWKGMPLYYFIKDTKAGDITGDGINGFALVR